MNRTISLCDITMMQKSSSNGGNLSFGEKIELAKILDKLGISVIETGHIPADKAGTLLVRSICSAVSRSKVAVPVEILDENSIPFIWSALKGAGHPRLQVPVPTSTVMMEYFCHKKPAAIIEMIGKAVSECASLCGDVEMIAEDTTRSDLAFVESAFMAAVEAGAKTVTIGDSTGTILPDVFGNLVAHFRSILPDDVHLGVYCNNNGKLADACSIAAIRNGADEVKTSPYGNVAASCENLVKLIQANPDLCGAEISVKDTSLKLQEGKIRRLCEDAGKKSPSAASPQKAEIQDSMFSAGDSMDTIANAISKLGYNLDEDDIRKVYASFLKVVSTNGSIESRELDAIVASEASQVPPTYTLESYVINSGNILSSTCHLCLLKGETRIERVCIGDGPVDASFLAIETAIGRHFELDDFQIQSVTEGRQALGEAVVRLRFEEKIYSGRGVSTDIIGSSIMAYLNAVNKIVYEETRK